MNWEAIGAVGEILGGIAVFVSLLYLALQIRSSRRSDQIVAASGAASASDAWLGQIVRDENLFALYRRGMTDYESLSREEKGRFQMLILQYLRSIEAMWFHRQLGAIDPGFWSSMKRSVPTVVGSTGGLRSFERNREMLSPEFVEIIDAILRDSDCDRIS